MVTPHSLGGPWDLTTTARPATFRKSSQKIKGCQHSWCPAILSLSLTWLGFKTSNLKVAGTSLICSRLWVRGLLHSDWCFLSQQNSLPYLRCAWILCFGNMNSRDQVTQPLHVCLFTANKRLFAGSSWDFCPWRGYIPSSKCTLGRGPISPSATSKIITSLYVPSWARAVLLSQSTYYSNSPTKFVHLQKLRA